MTLYFADFESGVLPDGWGAQHGGSIEISKNTALNAGGSKGSVRGRYPGKDGLLVFGGANVWAAQTLEVFIEFDAKLPSSPSGFKHGTKFLKIFGGNDGVAYANTTFGLSQNGNDPSDGSLNYVGFGDGAAGLVAYDVQNVILLTGNYPSWIGRSYGKTAVVKTPQNKTFAPSDWGETWHHFRVQTKFNSGKSAQTELADGEYYLEIDGKVYVDAKGLFNRHWGNLPIEKVGLFDWTQNNKGEAFELWYDNFRVSKGGFVSGAKK